MAENEFQGWVKTLLDRHFGGSFQQFADRVGVTYSALKRSVKGGSTSVETLLRIAIATGERPKDIFAAANKTEIHELIEQVYGEAAKVPISKDARDLALAFDSIRDQTVKAYAKTTIGAILKHAPPSENTDDSSSSRKATDADSGARRVRRRGKA